MHDLTTCREKVPQADYVTNSVCTTFTLRIPLKADKKYEYKWHKALPSTNDPHAFLNIYQANHLCQYAHATVVEKLVDYFTHAGVYASVRSCFWPPL